MSGTTRVVFTVVAETKIGETIRITGDVWSLGGFRPDRGLELVTTPDTYPVWRTQRPVLLPSGRLTEYKYLMFKNRNTFAKWEPIQAHSRQLIPEGSDMEVRDVFGQYKYTPVQKPEKTRIKTRLTSGVSHDEMPRSNTDENSKLPDRGVETQGSTGAAVASLQTNEEKEVEGRKRANSAPTGTQMGLVRGATQKPTPKHRVFIVSFHLPVKIFFNPDEEGINRWTVEWDHDNLISKTEDSIAEEHDVTWIGAVTNVTLCNFPKPVYSLSATEKEEIRTVIEGNMECVPLFLDEAVYQAHYMQCCKGNFHDVFHNVLNLDSDEDSLMSTAEMFEGFMKGNQIFADAVLSRAQESGPPCLAWIHDYHLMLVPGMLRASNEKLKVVFFLHIPFPTSEVFRTQGFRNDMLNGMLGADIIGFHTFDHARHFLISCKRFLGLQYHSRKGGSLMIDNQGRPVLIAVSHVGVEPESLNRYMKSSQVKRLCKRLKLSFEGKLVIASVDRLQRLKGTMLKLLAFQQLLQDCPRWRKKVLFVLHGIRRTDDASSYKDRARSAHEVKELIEKINKEYGNVVRYTEHSDSEPSANERIALWMSVDVMVSTPVMEGLNLYPLEYQYCHNTPPGAVIVSEFSTCSRILNGALRVNCFDIESIADAYDQALCMSDEERQARRSRDFEYVRNRPSSKWTRSIIAELSQLHSSSRTDNETITIIDGDGAHGADTVTAVQHVMYKGSCRPIEDDKENLLAAYSSAKLRLILLDYGGTITSREEGNLSMKRDFLGVSRRKLSSNILTTLKRLCADPKNIVFIVSGNTCEVLTTAFGEILNDPKTPLGLVAHSGLSVRWGDVSQATSRARRNEDVDLGLTRVPHRMSNTGWEHVLPGVSEEWAEWMKALNAAAVLDEYTWRTGGSTWTQSSVTTTWDFRQCDPEWGGIQANHLQEDLQEALQKVHLPVSILRKKNTVQLAPKGVSKGTAVELILRELPERISQKMSPDFALSFGDDIADEFMFKSLLDVYRPQSENLSGHENSIKQVFTCTVGRKPTEAQYYVESPNAVMSLLSQLALA